MTGLVEFIPNFSEGRRTQVIEALADAARSVSGVSLLDYSADADHNRSVFTLLGERGAMAEAALVLAQAAAALIDMREHRGAHPRIGAADVFPFVPLRGMAMEECAALAREAGERIWRELGIPVFLYGETARSPERADLAEIRRGGFEGMPEKLLLPAWAPDYGGRKIHPTAGVIAVGARPPLIAFNINLDTPDMATARAIARKIRASGGGFPHCKAIAVMLESRGLAQVSCNLTNYEETPIYRVFDAVKAEAERLGAGLAGSELVGLAPAKAFADCAAHYLKLENYAGDRQILEHYVPSPPGFYGISAEFGKKIRRKS